MQLIDELEPARRGPYCGALGYFGADGALELAIAIRIGVLDGGELRVHVGGGIVADSDTAAELAETEPKAPAGSPRSPGSRNHRNHQIRRVTHSRTPDVASAGVRISYARVARQPLAATERPGSGT